MFCVYEHIRHDTNAIFYVGKGSHRRAHSKHGRNKHWKSVVSKSGGYSVRLIADNIEEDLSFLVEMERIDQLNRMGFKLTNKTDGGEGPSGFRHTEETKRKITESQLGQKHWAFGKSLSLQHRINIGKSSKGRITSEETKAKLSEAGKNRVYTDKVRQKLSQSKTGRKHHMANTILFDGKLFGTAKELADYTGVKYGTVRTRLRLYPEKFGYKLLGYTKDLKEMFND